MLDLPARVMLAAYFGGFWPGALATAISAPIGNYFLLEHRRQYHTVPGGDTELLRFLAVGLVISGLNHAPRQARASLMAEERRRANEVVQETTHRFEELVKAEAKLRESERRYRSIFETAGVSIWEEDFSQVKAAIDDLKARGVSDVGAYLDDHPEFVEQAIPMVRILD